MTERKKSSAGFWAILVVLGAASVPFLYVASLGPVEYLLISGTIDGATYITIVYPWGLFEDSFGGHPSWFWDSCNNYFEWWCSLAH